eukprot:TRINITY_DN29044_c0_g1_i1.p1 TRINITY_DN29044_c0_g1~~TRINITY_DN29044_c0_g1_i1.p1  ORF type:complete len:210 (-),score=10.02 TRINITY_DN29044_c0_g1_i1:300-878(-)
MASIIQHPTGPYVAPTGHHAAFRPGEHVMVKHYGGATVVPCKHQDHYAGRVEVQYDDDGSTYHCYPSKLTPWPRYGTVPLAQLPERASSLPDMRPAVSAEGPKSNSEGVTETEHPHQHHHHHHVFEVGDVVFVQGYGQATVMSSLLKEGPYAGRYLIRYEDDGLTYHCYPSKLHVLASHKDAAASTDGLQAK